MKVVLLWLSLVSSCSCQNETLHEGTRQLENKPKVLQRMGLIKECKTTGIGYEYMGQISRTTSGRHCQEWVSLHPHRHSYRNDSMFPDASARAARNYCRNPKPKPGPEGPWCYTTDPGKRWETCTVPLCTDIIFHVEYRGDSPLKNIIDGLRRVPYDHVNMNVANVYRVALHAFVAPQPGVYMFMVDGFSSKPGPGCIELRQNQAVVGQAYTSGDHSAMSISRPLKLKKDDAVFVTMCSSVSNTLHNGGRNAFTGHLLTQTL